MCSKQEQLSGSVDDGVKLWNSPPTFGLVLSSVPVLGTSFKLIGTKIQRRPGGLPALEDIAFPASRLGGGVAMPSQHGVLMMHEADRMSSAILPTYARDSSELGRSWNPQSQIGVRTTLDGIVYQKGMISTQMLPLPWLLFSTFCQSTARIPY
jgi:hypothetical protein